MSEPRTTNPGLNERSTAGDPDPASGAGSPPRESTLKAAVRPAAATAQSETSADDTDLGWGEIPADDSRDDWFRRERPPHHGD